MKKKILVVLLAVLLVGSMLFAAGDKEKVEAKPRIALSQANLESPFPQGQRMGAFQRAEELGYEILHYVAENDATRQLAQIEDALSSKAQAVIVWPVDSEGIVAAVDAASKVNVPYIALSRMPADLSRISAAAVVDNFGAASMMVHAINEHRKSKGWSTINVIELVGDLGDQNAIERTEGYQSEASRYGFTTVARVPTEWDPEKAYDGLVAALRANPNAQAIYVPSDFLWPAVQSALETAGMLHSAFTDPDKHVFVAAMDGAPDGLEGIRQGYLDFNLNQDPIMLGQLVVDLAHKLIMGEDLPELMVPVENVPVTIENVDNPTYWGNIFAP